MTNRDMLTQIFPNNIEDRLCPQALDSNVHCPNMSISCDTCTDRWFQAKYISPNSAEPEEEEEPQFTREQEERIDEVYNAVLEMCCKLTAGGEKEVEYNMALLGPLADNIAEYLTHNGYEVYFPTQTTEENGKTVIYNFYDH